MSVNDIDWKMVKRLLKDGKSFEEIGFILSEKPSVLKRESINRGWYVPRPLKDWDTDLAENLHQEGLSFAEIGRTIGIHPEVVRSHLIRRGLHRPSPHSHVKREMEKPIRLLRAGHRIPEISRSTGIPAETLRRRFYALGEVVARNNLTWDVERFERLVDKGVPMEAAARHLGVDGSTAASFLERRGKHRHKHKPVQVEVEAIRRMILLGHTQREIAKILGVSPATICRRLKKAGLDEFESS